METGFQFALAAFFAQVIERLKQSSAFGWITPYTDGITKILAAFTAVLTAVGISSAWTVDPVTHLAMLTFGGIPTTFDGWGTVLVGAFTSYWFQKGYYLAAIKPQVTGVKVSGTGDPVERIAERTDNQR